MMRYGKWELIRELGRGGQGIAHLAIDSSKVDIEGKVLPGIKQAVSVLTGSHTPDIYDTNARKLADLLAQYFAQSGLENCAALKVLHENVRQDQKAIGRLKREIEVLEAKAHPHIVQILDAGTEQGWFVTTYYPQRTLDMHRTKFMGKPLEALQAFRPMVEAVAILHEKGIVHRDIKPQNIFVTDQGLVLGDLGIVHFEDDGNTRITDTYENVGSRDWMPGWAMGLQLDEVHPAFDVFGLGKFCGR